MINKHIYTEWVIFKNIWHQLIPTVFFLLYFGIIVFRSLAFLRHEQGPRLKDLGFEIFPKNDHLIGFSNIVLSIQHSFIIFLSVLIFIKNYKRVDDVKGPYIINIWRRYFNIITIGNTLRFVTYISTSLPGPADHCQPGSTNYHKPDKWYKVFYEFNTANCGDLIFSGHMFHLIIAMFIFNKYVGLVLNHRLSLFLKIITWSLIPLEIFLIISTRQHYTVDIVVAIYTSIFLWIVYDIKIQPKDYIPRSQSYQEMKDILIQ